MVQYAEVLSFFEHTIDIGQRSLPANQPNRQVIRRCTEQVEKKLYRVFIACSNIKILNRMNCFSRNGHTRTSRETLSC